MDFWGGQVQRLLLIQALCSAITRKGRSERRQGEKKRDTESCTRADEAAAAAAPSGVESIREVEP